MGIMWQRKQVSGQGGQCLDVAASLPALAGAWIAIAEEVEAGE
jgi:hypothetical protein